MSTIPVASSTTPGNGAFVFEFRAGSRGRSPSGHLNPRRTTGTFIPAAAPFRPVTGGRDRRPVLALDWAVRRIHTTRDGVTVTEFPTALDLLETLQEPHRIVAEATFESWEPQRRRRMVEAIRAAGHELYVFHPRHTARARKRWDIEKSDAHDVQVIYRIATQTRLHLYPLLDPDSARAERRERVNAEYLELRLHERKPELVAAALEVLAPYKSLEPDLKLVLGNGKRYSDALLAAAWHAAQHATSRAEFEDLLGLHGSAYPSLMRSDVHHHYFRWAAKRGVTWAQVRPAIRGLYAQLKAARPRPPQP